MFAISTEDAYTRLAAEDTCKFHTPSKHENALYDAFNDKKSEKGRTIVFKWQNIIDLILDPREESMGQQQNNMKIIDMTFLMKRCMKRVKYCVVMATQ